MASLAGANDLSTLNGLFKKVYSDEIENLIPDGVKLVNKIEFASKKLLGDSYNQPVVLN